MGTRNHPTCLLGSTHLITQNPSTLREEEVHIIGPNTAAISGVSQLSVGIDVSITFPAGPSPLTVNVTQNPDFTKIKPIKAYSGNYVYPLIRFEYNVQKTLMPLVDIKVKVPLHGVTPDMSSDPNSRYKNVTTTLLHAFMSEFRLMKPAYALEPGDKVKVNIANDLTFQKRGIVIDTSVIPFQTVYGLILSDKAGLDALNVNNNTLTSSTLQPITETFYNLYEKQKEEDVVEKEERVLESLIEYSRNFVQNIHPSPQSGKVNGLEPNDHVIFTNGIATGSIDIQTGLYMKHRFGYYPHELVP
jgi:hypothetical protein